MSYSPTIAYYGKTDVYIVTWVEDLKMKSKNFFVRTWGTKKNAHKNAEKFVSDEIPKRNYTKTGDIIKISVKDFLGLTAAIKRQCKIFSSEIDFQDKEIDIDPYILGYWLGDGASSSTKITTAESEIIEYFTKFAKENSMFLKKIGKSKYDYNVTTGTKKGNLHRNPFLNFLKENDLINNKHIPDCYKFNSEAKRLKLLAGIIDSDGYYSKGCYDLIFKSEKLADDIIFLARSLGFKCFKKQCKKTCTNSAKGRVTGIYFRFGIAGYGLDEIPSILHRKKAHKRQLKKDITVTGFTIKYMGKKTSYQLKTKKSLFLLGDFTVIHK